MNNQLEDPSKKRRRRGAKKKLEEYFLANVGKILTSGELGKIAGASEWGRRLRELRDEEGYDIQSKNDRNDLSMDEYILVSAVKKRDYKSTSIRKISKRKRAEVLDRDGNTCQMCGIGAGEEHPDDNSRKARLQIGHIIDKSHDGSDDLLNLRALCSVCNEGASNITQERPTFSKLMAQIRRAPIKDQKQVLQTLVKKYLEEAKELIGEKGFISKQIAATKKTSN